VLGGIGVLVAVGGPLYDLGLHPQFYTYNHVFGGVLGPIYDEQLAVRPGLFAFRGLTLLWALCAGLLGRRLRGSGPRWGVPVCALAIGAVYLWSVPLGINTSATALQDRLGGHTRTAHFDLYYDSTQVDAGAAADLAADHEAKYEWIRRRLGSDTTQTGPRIQSYLYPNPDVKGRLTGARTTSVSPVWLATPQVHLLRERVAQSLGHELAHVVSRPHGLPGINASWAPGLVEGWAVALEPPSFAPSPDDLVRTAAQVDTATTLAAEAEAITTRLSPWGFWTGRGAVSYATMGSFVEYLLDRYGPDRLKRVYGWGHFASVYDQSLETLAREWAAHLRRGATVSRDAHDVVTRRFTRPSLFERDCPHYVPPARRHYQAAQRAGRRRDTTEMRAHLRDALVAEPRFAAAHEALARLRLARGQAAAVQQQLDSLSASVRTVGIQGALADAHALLGNADTARALYETARDQASGYAHDLRARLLLRVATAQHPEVVRVLTSRDSAAAQARRLAALRPQSAVVRAWRAVRWMDANRYSRALAIWRQLESPIPADRPREWRRTWALQRTAWGTTAALRVGSTAVARRWADRGRDRSRRLGDKRRAAVFAWWERRAEVPGATRGEASSSLTRPNHASGLLVQEARMPYEGPSRRGACASF
jgi:tetratricopeptide (TPR) repeat protein